MSHTDRLRILGIETSCDETAVAVFEAACGSGRILCELLHSQTETHAPFGGIVPEIASREHLARLPAMVETAMSKVDGGWASLTAIAVTAGPGLLGALLVGVCFARGAGLTNRLTVVPVHHLEAHLLAVGLDNRLPDFPFITLLVSGGHTLLVRVDGVGQYRILGQTLDDAAGECFDKVARLLGLPYPGGPAIARLAQKGNPDRFQLPRPLAKQAGFDFSFSGLKTAVMQLVREDSELPHHAQKRRDLAASFQEAVVDVLVQKSLKACENEGVHRLVVAGGVAANARLRQRMTEAGQRQGCCIHLPRPSHCTDNAAMVAHAAYLRLRSGLASPECWDADPRLPLF